MIHKAYVRQLESTFAARTKNVSNGLRENLLFAEQTVQSMANLFEAKMDTSRDEFTEAASHLMTDFLGIRALEWVPKVPQSQRESHEEAAREDGLIGFSFRGWQHPSGWKSINGHWADEYYPVYFVYPLKNNEEALGIDLGSHPSRRDALVRAKNTGKVAATGRIQFAQEKEQQPGFLLFAPVRDEGFTLGVFQIKDLVETVLASRDVRGLELRIIDASAQDAEGQLLYETSNYKYEEGSRWNSVFSNEIGGRKWEFAWNFHPDFVAAERGWGASLTLLIGITLSGLVGRLLQEHTRRQVEIERLVDERTEQLEHSENRMQQTFKSSPSGLVITNAKGEITMVNPQLTEMFGHQSEDLIGQPIELLVPERYRTNHVLYREGYQNKREMRPMGSERELYGLRGDGAEFPVEIGLTPLGKTSGSTMATINDISERIRHERTIRQKNEQLTRLNTELLEFAYSTSHDLKAPLASITGLLGFCESDLTEGDTEEVLANIKKAKELAKRLAERVESILTLAKSDMESGEFESICVLQRVKDAWDALPNDGVSLETSLEHIEPIQSVAVRFDAILENLLSNAVKYQDPKQIEKVVRVSTWTTDDNFYLSVEDNGVGIPEEYHDKVFRLFQRLANSDTPGTGLGLPLVKKCVARLGGHIELNSGKVTTTFTVRLPQSSVVSQIVRRTHDHSNRSS